MANSSGSRQWKVKDLSREIFQTFVGRSIEVLGSRRVNHDIIDHAELLHIPHPCIIHIVDYENYGKHRVKAWFKEYLIKEDEPEWEYDNDNYEKIVQQRDLCWVCRWFELKPTLIVRIPSGIESTEERSLPSYYRLSGDWRNYDRMDGIDVILQYPVWINETLFKDEDDELCRQRLVDTFHRLNDERRDHHSYPSPVEDIVDPDLLSYCPSVSTAPNTLLRDSYQWIPSKFIVNNETDEVRIVSPICHLPNRNEVYKNIAKIFSKMLPMFREIKGLTFHERQTEFQVVVKAQSYNLEHGMKYSGRWHTEGQTENILAVGVYYLHVDRQLKGGALKFRPKSAMEYGSHEVNVETGAAIVFENVIPHRFRQIRNLSLYNRRRTFLNFFIIDPRYPIQLDSSQLYFGYQDQIRNLLNEFGLKFLNNDKEQKQRRLPDLVIERILSFLPKLWSNIEQAKEFRQLARREMLEMKLGWGYIHFGNTGIVQFIEQANSSDEQLRHTESE